MEYKKDQNWVVKTGDYLVFPGGGTQFKDGVTNYIESIEKVVCLLYILIALLRYNSIQYMFTAVTLCWISFLSKFIAFVN